MEKIRNQDDSSTFTQTDLMLNHGDEYQIKKSRNESPAKPYNQSSFKKSIKKNSEEIKTTKLAKDKKSDEYWFPGNKQTDLINEKSVNNFDKKRTKATPMLAKILEDEEPICM